jgi:hypothetical protein
LMDRIRTALRRSQDRSDDPEDPQDGGVES